MMSLQQLQQQPLPQLQQMQTVLQQQLQLVMQAMQMQTQQMAPGMPGMPGQMMPGAMPPGPEAAAQPQTAGPPQFGDLLNTFKQHNAPGVAPAQENPFAAAMPAAPVMP